MRKGITLFFFIIIIMAILGFTDIAREAAVIAKILFYTFLVWGALSSLLGVAIIKKK